MFTRLILLFLVFTIQVRGQTASPIKDSGEYHHLIPFGHNLSIGGSIGYGFPTELYGARLYPGGELTNNIGFADPGFHFDLTITKKLCKHFGYILEADGNINPLNNGAQEWFFPISGSYYLGEYLTGPFYSYLLKNGDEIQTRFLIGIATITENSDLGVLFSTKQFCGELGVKYKLHLSRRFYLAIDVAFTQTAPVVPSYYAYDGRFAILTSGLGIEYKF